MTLARKFVNIAAAAAVALSMAGCTAAETDSSKELSIVCAGFPEYDWTKNILGSHTAETELTYLLENGEDIHSYQPSAEDMVKIADCDLFIYTGGESQEWAADAIKSAVDPDMRSLSLIDILGSAAKEEEFKEGMTAEAEETETTPDEHVWLSVGNAKLFCQEITDVLCEIDSENAADFREGYEAYTAQLDALDSDYKTVTNELPQKTLIVCDRFPFRYLADEYGLDYYAAFSGCSAETEASFETVAFLAEKADELGVNTVFTLENSDQKLARAVIENSKNTDRSVAELNSLQSVTRAQIDSGTTYISLMRQNLDCLKQNM